MLNGQQVYEEAYKAAWRPEPRLSVSAWVEDHCRLENGNRLDLEVTPYMRELLDALGPKHPGKRVIGMFGSQLGKTTGGLAWLIFIMAQCPAPTLVLRPSIDDARDFCRERLDPIIESTSILRGRVKEARSRDGGNTLTRKEFAGGFASLAGAKSPRGLKSRPIRFIFADEIDDFPGDIKEQGDPIVLAEKRCQGPHYPRRKVFLIGTPTLKGISRIEREYLKSDRRRFFVPCPYCGHMDFLTWRGEDKVSGVAGIHHRMDWDEGHPETARLVCSSCGEKIAEGYKGEMLKRGEWRPTAAIAESPETIGFHLSSLYSPPGWLPWRAIVAEFLEKKSRPMEFKGWINSVLAESWDEPGLSIDPGDLMSRVEEYCAEVPNGVGILVASVDVHGNRLEAAVIGYGAGEESWLIASVQFMGDPGQDKVWFQLDEFLQQEFQHEGGQRVRISCVTVDAGDGHFSEHVYRFCQLRFHRRIFAIKGGSEIGKPIVGRPSMTNRYKVPLYVLCTDTAKELIYSRLSLKEAGPGYYHLPNSIDAEFAAQLTAEKAVRKWVKGKGMVRTWVPVRERNEALDLTVYCLAALYIVLGRHGLKTLAERAADLAKKPEALAAAGVPVGGSAESAFVQPSPPSWVDGWRG